MIIHIIGQVGKPENFTEIVKNAVLISKGNKFPYPYPGSLFWPPRYDYGFYTKYVKK